MKLALTPEEVLFHTQVADFVRQHWTPDPGRLEGLAAELDGQPWSASLRRWFRALADAGWWVPHWPVADGGAGWAVPRMRLFLHALAEAGAPSPVTIATGIVGPLLTREAHSAARASWLAGIRDRCERWSVASAEPVGGAPVRATAVRSGYLLAGEKTWVSGGLHADRLLCRAAVDGGEAWFVVDAGQAGVTRQPLALMGLSGALARFVFADVELAPDARLRTPPAAGLPEPPLRIRTPAFQRSLAQIRDTATRHGDDALGLEAARLAVAVTTLEALENRVAFAVDAAAPALRRVLALRAVEVGQALSSLRARSMGYDAVPFPDEARFHNEGVFGDELALPVVREALFDRAWSLYAAQLPGQAASVEAVRDHLAREVLGFDRPGPD